MTMDRRKVKEHTRMGYGFLPNVGIRMAMNESVINTL
jgi:hypothetical protein